MRLNQKKTGENDKEKVVDERESSIRMPNACATIGTGDNEQKMTRQKMTSSFFYLNFSLGGGCTIGTLYKSPTVQYGSPGQVRRRLVTMTSAKISSGKSERQLASPSSLVGMLIIVVIIYSRRLGNTQTTFGMHNDQQRDCVSPAFAYVMIPTRVGRWAEFDFQNPPQAHPPPIWRDDGKLSLTLFVDEKISLKI